MKLRQCALVGLLAALPLAAKAEDTSSTKIPLEPGKSARGGGGFKQLAFNKENEASIPFATASGQLKFKLDGRKIVADINGDGKIDKADGDGVTRGMKISIPIKSHGKALTYDIQFSFMHNKVAYLNGMTVLNGKYNDKPFTIMDSNMNGKFNDTSIDVISFGSRSSRTPITSIASFGGKIKVLAFTDDSAELVLKAYTGEIGELTLKSSKTDWMGMLMLVKSDGTFNAVINSQTKAELIPGIYHIGSAVYANGGFDYTTTKGMLYGQSQQPITVVKGSNELAIGAPFKLQVVATKSKENPNAITIEEVQLIGSLGINYRATVSGGKSKSTLTSFIRAGEKRQDLTKMEYG